ncbi:hypothetical protein OG592_41790 (plasmid) [Streptomyces avidinii]|uniref:hypothetical protein n=1 Tax=Streptomyces avidinii TaxID=1895 RepID=UPI002F90BB18|nr:hypothetical protein OG592_41790 [Streptomyces avidinii]
MPEPLPPLPPALDQLLVIRRRLELTLARVDEKISVVRAADEERARRRPPPEPARWRIEYGIGVSAGPTASTQSSLAVRSGGSRLLHGGAKWLLLVGVVVLVVLVVLSGSSRVVSWVQRSICMDPGGTRLLLG